MKKTLIVIPARLKSKRLPNKLIKKIHNKEIIVWVAQRIATLNLDYIVAIDDIKIGNLLQKYNIPFMLTDPMHLSGTSRVSEIASKLPQYDFYCCVQGDEPLINPKEVYDFIKHGKNINVGYLNAVCKFCEIEDPKDTANVKALIAKDGRLLEVSRNPINIDENLSEKKILQICGLYLFSRDFMANYKKLSPSQTEVKEGIEQLRCLDAGVKVQTLEIQSKMLSVDTPSDFKKISKINKSDFIVGIN